MGQKKIGDFDQNLDFPDCNRVATVREKSGKFKSLSESGKSQGILLQVRDFAIKVREKSGNFVCGPYQGIIIPSAQRSCWGYIGFTLFVHDLFVS